MARPEEKAQARMNKWVKMRDSDNTPQASTRRPYLASLCEHLHDAEKWRRHIIREISGGVSKIQNQGMGDHAVRDLNDEINKLIREKYHWNKRIVQLGGPDYNKIERHNQLAEQGKGQDDSMGLQGSSGYRYFGIAKDLPGVKELFARNAVKVTKKKRGDVYKYITPDYYGLRDEEDGVLLEVEEIAAKKRKIRLEALRAEYRQAKSVAGGEEMPEYETDDEFGDSTIGSGGVLGAADAVAAHVAVPTQYIVQKTILERKKKALLDSLL
jgi:pre-mRNA-splicing factor ISY1